MKLRSNSVYQYRPTVEEEEKELVARAVDAAKKVLKTVPSSYDVAAVTPGVNVDKEKSLEQETEEDARSTTSTIDYDFEYTDEESTTVSETETEDDEDEDGDEIMEESKQDFFPGVYEPDTDDSESDDNEIGGDSALPDKNDWVASWNKKDPRELDTWIDVYAYFRKEQGDGGYGVILRDEIGKPIVASAEHSAQGKSFFYQVLLGIKAGLKLAESRELFDYSVRCNSYKVPQLILDARRCNDVKCKEATEVDNICKGCWSYLNFYAGGDAGLLPLIQDLKRLEYLRVAGFPRVSNDAAYYLAKMAKDKRLIGEEIKPDAFPPKLKDILWEDVMRSSSYR